jgi:NADPH:quinone reductase-like Zn-dependent oxidoreductase
VLNSLAGNLVDASLRLLAPGGRFVEIGKSDIRDQREVCERHPGIAYTAFALPDTPPERLGEMLADVVELCASGRIEPPPVTTWRPSQARSTCEPTATTSPVSSCPTIIGPR